LRRPRVARLARTARVYAPAGATPRDELRGIALALEA